MSDAVAPSYVELEKTLKTLLDGQFYSLMIAFNENGDGLAKRKREKQSRTTAFGKFSGIPIIR